MGDMDISSRAEFAADPTQVFSMLTDEAFLRQVCEASGSLESEVSASGDTTTTSRTLPAPDSAKKFTGATLTVIEKIVWGSAGADGARTGQVTLSVPGQPVTMNGEVRLSPGGAGSTLDLTGVLKVNIPLVGKKLEQSAAPAVLAGFGKQQEVGNSWLAA